MSVKTVSKGLRYQKINPNKNIIMAPKSKQLLIMAALSLKKKKMCAVALIVMLDKVENEDTGRRSVGEKDLPRKKILSLSHISR